MKFGCDILNLEWSSIGRDVDIVEPVLCHLEHQHRLKVIRDGMANYELKLLWWRPKLLLISNHVGAYENFNLVKLASKLGIRCVSLVSEGDYPETKEGVHAFFWGWNKDKIYYEDLHLEWSFRSLELIHKYIPESKKIAIQVCGATSFDRYKLFTFAERRPLLEKYSKASFERVITFVGWAFDLFSGQYFKDFTSVLTSVYTQQEIELFRNSSIALRNIYREIIIANPQVLFILKFHPGSVDKNYSEFFELGHYQNTLQISREENIADILNISDFIVAFESTTALESWLLGKPSFLVNPLGSDFKRSVISRGSPILRTADELQNTINAFYMNQPLPNFIERQSIRDEIVSEILGWDDGKNHIRAANAILGVFFGERKSDLKWRDPFIHKSYIKALLKFALWKTPLLNKLFKSRLRSLYYLQSLFKRPQRELIRQKYLEHLIKFYEKFGPYLDLTKSNETKSGQAP